MENLSLKAILSVSTLTAALTLTGCDQAPQENEQAKQTTTFEQADVAIC